MTRPRTLCCRLFRIDARETDYVRRGFRGANDSMRKRMERVGAVFTTGYHSALEIPDLRDLVENLERVELEWRGFAYEGAAMGLSLLDHLTPWQPSRIREFLKGAGNKHAYMVHVGVGWVWARLPFFVPRRARELDPLLRWLAFDGWGFHEGFFHWPDYVAAQAWPRRVRSRASERDDHGAEYETRAFDQGLGRSFWFVNGGNIAWIERTIDVFPEERRGDLWSGIGLAAVYAGGVAKLEELVSAADEFRPQLAQGACFAAKARERAGNLTEYTEIATRALCEMSAVEAAQLTDSTLENLPASGSAGEPAYEIWRQRIQGRFGAHRQRGAVENDPASPKALRRTGA
jgi:hypothetical protein